MKINEKTVMEKRMLIEQLLQLKSWKPIIDIKKERRMVKVVLRVAKRERETEYRFGRKLSQGFEIIVIVFTQAMGLQKESMQNFFFFGGGGDFIFKKTLFEKLQYLKQEQ